MKKICIIVMATALRNEKGPNRFSYLADYLSNKGFEVDLVTSNYQHWNKEYREIKSLEKEKYGIIFCDQPKYYKNIDLKRIYSLYKFSKNIKKYLKKNIKKYDLIYSSIPDNFVALEVTKLGKKNNIPVILDIEDLWPEAMKMVLDIPMISNVLFYPFTRSAEIAYSLCNGVIGTSDEYRDRPFQKLKRDIPRKTVYVGNELKRFDKGIAKYSSDIEKSNNEFWITYAGTIGKSYDLETLLLVAKELFKKDYKNIKFKILGLGPDLERLKKLISKDSAQVEFLGYVEYEKMAAYLSKSDIVINSFVKKAPQSIVTKIGDYLASGKPMINTCSSIEFKNKVEKDNFGINIEAENVEELEKAILELYQNEELAQNLGKNARKVAEEEFDREKSYYKIVEMINMLLGENNEKI